MTTLTVPEHLHAGQPSRYFTVRFARFLGRRAIGAGRFIRSRRMVYTMAASAVLVGVFYQYENWNGAREIAAAREQLVARIGTLDPMALLPAEVPEAENFFALPVIKSWRVANPKAAGGFEMVVPDGLQVSKELIAQLAEGLERPFSQLIPCYRRALADAGGDAVQVNQPSIRGIWPFYQELARQMRTSALEGDAPATRNLAGIMLKFSEAYFAEPTELSAVMRSPLQEMTLPALNDGLACASLTESDLAVIQNWLLRVDDLKQMEKVFQKASLERNEIFIRLKQAALNHDLDRYFGHSGAKNEDFWFTAFNHGPDGWWDANGAFAIGQLLPFCGDGGPENWRSAEVATQQAHEKMVKAATIHIAGNFGLLNPRRAIGGVAIPNFSTIWSMGAKDLAKRRCAILTCALHRHRLLHGSYPASLTELDASLLPGPQPDPARAEAPLNYRLTGKGFLLWSVGMDRVDDGGDANKDWIWKHDA